MKKTFSLVGIGLLLAGGAFFFFRREAPGPLVASAPLPPSAQEPATSAGLAAFRAAPPLQRVMDLYEQESGRVGAVDPDPVATQKRLEESARELRAEEIAWLESQAMDPKTPMDARFFGVYLLGLSHSRAAIDSLGRIALSPVPPSKNERKLAEDRALRASAAEGISHHCRDFPQEAKDKELDILQGQSDELVRDRAHRGLYTCQTGKPLEDADKGALGKLRRQH